MKLFNLEMDEDFRFTRLTMSEIHALSIGPIALPLALLTYSGESN